MQPFHLAFPVRDLAAARCFYEGALGCRVGRSAPTWIDFELYGHQLSAHLRPDMPPAAVCGAVDGDAVPIPHFGVVLEWNEWEALAERLRGADARFVLEPKVRYRGDAGEQGTFFVLDPSGNALEFKAMREPQALFVIDDSDAVT